MRGAKRTRSVPLSIVFILFMSPVAVGGTAGSGETDPTSPIMEQYGCRSDSSGHIVPPDWARERLPTGYQPRLLPNAWMPATGASLGAFLMVKAWSCARSVVDGNDVAPGATYLYYLAVTPPTSMRAAGTAAYWLPLEIVATSADELAAYQTWGLHGSVLGAASIDETVLPRGRLVEARADSGTNRFDTTLPFESQGGPMSGFRVRYFAYDGTSVTGYVDIHVEPHISSGYASVLRFDGPDDPWRRPSVGTSSSQLWNEEERSYTWSFQAV